MSFSTVDPVENQRITFVRHYELRHGGLFRRSYDRHQYSGRRRRHLSRHPDLSFFYHLGDIIYTMSGSDAEGSPPVKPYSHSLWDNQFFAPYARFPKKIFAIAGNHDGKYTEKIEALRDFFRFFCADTLEPPPGPKSRRRMTQPYMRFRNQLVEGATSMVERVRTVLCTICGKPVSLEECEVNDLGQPVHEACRQANPETHPTPTTPSS